MCCLRFEDECYETLRKNLPRRNTWIRTNEYLGKVVDTQIITQLVRLILADNTQVVVGVDELTERDVPPPSEEQLRTEAENHAIAQRKKSLRQAIDFTSTPGGVKDEPVPADDSPRKSPEDRKGDGYQEPGSQKDQSRQQEKKSTPGGKQPKQEQQSGDLREGKGKKKKRRRQRRKKKPK